MAKKKKLTKEELEAVNAPINAMNQVYLQMGRMVVSLLKGYESFEGLEAQVVEQQKSLEEKYGSVNIDLTTGEITKQEELAE